MDIYSLSIRSCALPWISLLTRSNFWRLYRLFRRDAHNTLYSPPRDRVLEKLQDLVQHAYNYVPFYRERMEAVGLSPDRLMTFDTFQQMPPITKVDIAANFPDRLLASRQEFKPWRYVSTSGTIQRMTAVQDFRKRDFVRAAQLFSLFATTGYEPGMRYVEIPPDVCTNICGVSNTLEPNVYRYFFENLTARKLSDTSVISDLRGLIERQIIYKRIELPAFSAEGLVQKPETLSHYLQQIRTYKPYVVKALPIYLYLLARHVLERNITPPHIMGGLMPMGGSMTPYMKHIIETAFGCQVHEDYGCAELGTIAAECGRQSGVHPFAGMFYVEVVRSGRPVGEGEVGKVLITDLYNYAMPLIRYDIGDVAVVRQGPCACGLIGDRLEVQGRAQDCLVAEDGTILTSDRVMDVILKRPDVLGFQLEAHEGGKLYLQVVSRGPSKPDVQEIRQSLSDLLGGQVNMVVRIVPTILPEPGGKFRFVKNFSNVSQTF